MIAGQHNPQQFKSATSSISAESALIEYKAKQKLYTLSNPYLVAFKDVDAITILDSEALKADDSKNILRGQ
mgnify:CR=1 FL=1